jgi:hypothetical protein
MRPTSNLPIAVEISLLHLSYETGMTPSSPQAMKMGIFEARGCQEKKHLPAPLGDAGVVTYIQPPLIPHHILRGVIGLVALARRTFPRRCQPHLLVPTRWFHEVSGADAVRFRSYAS